MHITSIFCTEKQAYILENKECGLTSFSYDFTPYPSFLYYQNQYQKEMYCAHKEIVLVSYSSSTQKQQDENTKNTNMSKKY